MKFRLFTILGCMFVYAMALAEETTSIDVIFKSFTTGTQYAENEKHELGGDLVIYTTKCHFTEQLRIYSSDSYNGYVISDPLPGIIRSMSFNMGHEKDILNIYGSTDKKNWTFVKGIETTSTSYKNYTLEFPQNTSYTCFKLDVKGEKQIRIQSMSVTFLKNNNENEGEEGKEDVITISAPNFTPSSTSFNTESLDITINAGENYEIYYTTDGTTPSYTNAEKYVGTKGNVVTIYASDSKVTLQAIAVDPNTNKYSDISSATYTYVPITNDGTKEKPYTVAEVKAMTTYSSDEKWVKGTIYGTMLSPTDIRDGIVTSDFTAQSNIVIGNEQDYIPVQLKKGTTIRDEINLMNHPYLKGKEILIKGKLKDYCYSQGVIDLSEYKITYDIPINKHGYATLLLDMPVSVSQSSYVYYCTTEGNIVKLLPVKGQVVPANVGVIIKSSPNKTCKLSYTTEINPYENSIREANQLIGYTQDTNIIDSNNTYYALNVKDGKVGFYIPMTINGDGSFTAKAGKAYLKVPSESQAKEFLFSSGNDETFVAPINHYSDEVIYDLQGRVVSSPKAGIYIKAGRKVIFE